MWVCIWKLLVLFLHQNICRRYTKELFFLFLKPNNYYVVAWGERKRVLQYFHIYVRLGPFWGISIFLGVSVKWIYFGVWKNCKYFWGVNTKLDYFWCSFLYILGLLHKVKVQNGNIFWGLLKFQIFLWVCLIFLIFLGVNSRCWVLEPMYHQKLQVPP